MSLWWSGQEGGAKQGAENDKETFAVENSDGMRTRAAKNAAAQEDYLAMVYGDFLNSDDPRLHYNRKVLGILSLQVVLTLLVNCLCARIGGLNSLSSNIVVFAAAAFACVGSVVMLVTNKDHRTTLPTAHLLTACFIVGSAFLIVGLSQNLSDQFVLLILYAIATAVVSLFLGASFAKDSPQAEWYMQVAGAAGGAVTTLMVPFYLNHWYGEDYSMIWVLWTVVLNVLIAYYVYYDLLEYQGNDMIENDDYIYSFLRVYVDWMWIIFFAFLRFCWRKTTSSE